MRILLFIIAKTLFVFILIIIFYVFYSLLLLTEYFIIIKRFTNSQHNDTDNLMQEKFIPTRNKKYAANEKYRKRLSQMGYELHVSTKFLDFL